MNTHIHIDNIADLSRLFGPGQALHHPLIAVIDFSQITPHVADGTRVSSDFYTLIFKHYNRSNIKYGRKVIDFNDGSLICMAPQQILEIDEDTGASYHVARQGAILPS